ncbi:agmatinase [bacterium]|nr:agmatinase [bacterium]
MTKDNGFFDLAKNYSRYDNSDVVILRVPFERSTSYITGTYNAPDAILRASAQIELYDIETDSEPYKMGIHTAPALVFDDDCKPNIALDLIEKEVSKLLDDGKFPMILGGEHTITLGVYRAFQKHFKNITCVSLDAHSDLREEYLGDKFSHACVMRRISEIRNPILFGIRSMDKSEQEYAKEVGIKILYAHPIMEEPAPLESALEGIEGRIYLSIDMDVFDPAYAPAVGTPEPGGLDWYKILDIIKGLNKKCRIAGVDLVELSPIEGQIGSEFLAAKLIYKILAYKFISVK